MERRRDCTVNVEDLMDSVQQTAKPAQRTRLTQERCRMAAIKHCDESRPRRQSVHETGMEFLVINNKIRKYSRKKPVDPRCR
jgi:hypothetical protein